jgi:hypothetical protein
MDTWHAWKITVGSYYQQVAKRLKLSTHTINKWKQPSEDYSDSGTYNPSDRLIEAVEEVLAQGHDPKQAFSVLHQICQHFGGLFFPPVKSINPEHKELTHQSFIAMKEVSEGLATVADSLADGNITPIERRESLQQLQEGIHELAILSKLLEERDV